MVRAILFDVLGTLLTREPGGSAATAHENAMRRALASVDTLVPLPPYAEFQAAYEETANPPGVFHMETKLRDVFARLGLRPRAQRQLATRAAERYWREQGASLRKLPDVDPCLRALPEDVKLAAVTNWPDGPSLRATLNRTGLGHRFDAYAISGEVGTEKPDPALLQHALQALDVNPADALMVGDSLMDDLVPARSLGLRTALVLHPRPHDGHTEPMPGVDLTLGTLETLPHALTHLP